MATVSVLRFVKVATKTTACTTGMRKESADAGKLYHKKSGSKSGAFAYIGREFYLAINCFTELLTKHSC